jgi:predicted RNA-binding protein with RPS1 domain
VDIARQRINLSIKQALPVAASKASPHQPKPKAAIPQKKEVSFSDSLSSLKDRFKK